MHSTNRDEFKNTPLTLTYFNRPFNCTILSIRYHNIHIHAIHNPRVHVGISMYVRLHSFPISHAPRSRSQCREVNTFNPSKNMYKCIYTCIYTNVFTFKSCIHQPLKWTFCFDNLYSPQTARSSAVSMHLLVRSSGKPVKQLFIKTIQTKTNGRGHGVVYCILWPPSGVQYFL